MARGFGLTGWLRKSGVFEPRVKRPAFGKDTMLTLACGLNKAALKSMKSWSKARGRKPCQSWSVVGYLRIHLVA